MAISASHSVVTTSDGRNLDCLESGTGPNLVVFEAGLGLGGAIWLPTMDLLPDGFRALAYNRAGFGESSPDHARRDLPRLAADLLAVVRAQSYKNLVLVGHSWGGPIIRTAATSDTSIPGLNGLVLVDPSDDHLIQDETRFSIALQRQVLILAARLGFLKTLLKLTLRGLPWDVVEKVLEDSTTVAAAREGAAELREFLSGLKSLAGLGSVANSQESTTSHSPTTRHPISTPQHQPSSRTSAKLSPEIHTPSGGLRTVIISGALPDFGERKKTRAKVQAAHYATARQLNAELISAPHSGHLIPYSDPELIARTVCMLFGE